MLLCVGVRPESALAVNAGLKRKGEHTHARMLLWVWGVGTRSRAAAARPRLPVVGGKQLHSDAAQTAHDPSRPKAEVAGLKFRGQSSAVRRTVEFQSRPCYRGAAVS